MKLPKYRQSMVDRIRSHIKGSGYGNMMRCFMTDTAVKKALDQMCIAAFEGLLKGFSTVGYENMKPAIYSRWPEKDCPMWSHYPHTRMLIMFSDLGNQISSVQFDLGGEHSLRTTGELGNLSLKTNSARNSRSGGGPTRTNSVRRGTLKPC